MKKVLPFVFVVLSVFSLAIFGSNAIPNNVILKMQSSTVFIAAAIVGLVVNRKAFADSKTRAIGWTIFAALVLGWVGDLCLELTPAPDSPLFIVSMVAFILDHVLIITALVRMDRFRIRDVALFIGPLLLLIYTATSLERLGALAVPVYIYTAIVAAMLAKAVSVALSDRTSSELSILIPVGAFLFVCSDLMLSIGFFGSQQATLAAFGLTPSTELQEGFASFDIMLFYELGQTLIASSILFLKPADEPANITE
jgi:uncharacterized membrane protein YhhN